MIELMFKGLNRKDAKVRAKEILNKVGMGHRLHNRATKLSGGEKQRVVIARAIASDAQILVCDEPTGNLDSKNSNEIMRLLKEISANKLVLLVTHDESLIEGNANRIIRIKDGRIESDYKISETESITRPLDISSKNKVSTQLYIALKNVFRTPKKSLFVMVVFIILSFVLINSVSYLPTSIKVMDTKTTEYITFNNRDDNRIIVYSDTIPSEEFKSQYTVVENDYMLDVEYRVASYSTHLNQQLKSSSMIKTSLDHLELAAGRYPSNIYEILLILGDNYSESFYNVVLGSMLKIGIKNIQRYAATAYEIVGFAKYTDEYVKSQSFNKTSANQEESAANTLYDRTDFYVIPEALPQLFENALSIDRMAIIKQVQEDFAFIVDGKKIAPTFYEGNYTDIKISYKYFEKEVEGLYLGNKKIDIFEYPVDYVYKSDRNFAIGLSPNFVIQMLESNSFRYSVFASDDQLDQLYQILLSDENNDNVFMIRDLKDVENIYNIDGIVENLLSLVFLIVEILVSLFISILITSFVLGSKKKELGVLRVIGLSERDVLKILHFELLLLMCGAIVVSLGVAVVTIYLNVGFSFAHIFDNIPKLIASILILLIMTYFISLSWNKKMFKKSAREVLKVGDSL
jgi:energy-coupling factor transporter ATP-binding protein EcfA2